MARVQAALIYAATYPQEIDVALHENDTFDAEKVRRVLPQTRVIEIALADTPYLVVSLRLRLDEHFSDVDYS